MAPNTASKAGKKPARTGTRTVRVISGRTYQGGGKKALGVRGQRGKAKPPSAAARTARRPAGPLTDDRLGQVAGVPTEAEIGQLLGELTAEDRKVFGQIRQLLAAHLGSVAAARLWLVTPDQGSTVTPAQAIRDGRGKQVLGALKAQWGRNPVYA
jgi:hypothetical protein